MLKIVEPLGSRGSAPNPTGGAHSAPIPLATGEGACCPLLKNPTATLGFWPRFSALQASFGSLSHPVPTHQMLGAHPFVLGWLRQMPAGRAGATAIRRTRRFSGGRNHRQYSLHLPTEGWQAEFAWVVAWLRNYLPVGSHPFQY